MSLWKSPIVYVGTVLVLLIAALLSAPVVIDWNGYRASIEDYGRRLTGRQVTVVGDVSVHLFPWPRLRLEKVRIANVEGAMLPDMMRAEAVEARMLLGSLISGYVEVSDIRIEKPIVSFERLAGGDGNWWLDPEFDGAASVDARRVSIDNLEIIGGTVFLSDSRRGGTAQLNDVNAVLNAQTLLGPWRARGEASYKDMPISIGLSTGRFRPGEPFKFGVRLSPVDDAGFVYSFEGDYNPEAETALSGTIEATPYVSAEGKADSQARMRPFALKSKVSFKDDRVLLDQIEIAPADPQPSSNLLTGTAAIELKSRIAVHADLRSPKFDLDSVLGNEGRSILKRGSVLSALSGFLESVPETLDGRLKLEVGNLLMGGQSLEGATLETELAPSGLTVRTLSATMPGQTKGSFSGMFLADRDNPQLAGDLMLDSADSRAFLSWLVPEWSEAIARKWTGIRGKLALKARLDHAPESLRLSEGTFTLDETHASGSLSIAGKDRGDTALELILDRIDLDRYVADGPLIGSPDDGFGQRVATVTAAVGALGDLQLNFSAHSLLYHGVEARDVAAEVMSRGDAIEIRALDIGNVGDARLEVAGALEPKSDGRQGSGTITVSAADPRPLLRLLGIVPPVKVDVPEPVWAVALGPLDATLRGDLAIGKDRADANLDLSGTAGGSQITAEAGYEGPPGDPAQGSLKVVGEISSPTAKALAALLGLPGRTDDQEPARLDLRLAGEPAGGLKAEIGLDALGAKARYDGSVTVAFPGLALSADGRVDLRAGSGDRVLAALGIPNPRPGGSLAIETRTRTNGHRLDLDEFRATIEDLTYEGRLSLNDGRLDVAATAGELSLPWLVRLALLPNDGRPIEDVTLFAPEALGGVEGTITVDAARLTLLPGIDVRDGKTELSLADGTTRFAVAGIGPAGAPFTLDAGTTRRNDELELDVTFEGGLELGNYLRAAEGGAPVLTGPVAASGRITGHGRSPAGLALTLAGQGSVRLLDASLNGFDGRRFSAGIGRAKSASEVDRVLADSFGRGELAFQAGEGSFRLAQGEAVLGPVPVTAGDLTGTLTTVLDVTTGQYDVGLGLDLADETGLPPVEIAYTGQRDSLVRNLDASSLKSELSARALKESMEKLEQLQREQQAMFDERDQQVIEYAKRNAEIQGRRQLQEYARRLDKEMQAINADEMSRRRREIRAWDAIAARLRADAKLRQAKPEIVPVEKLGNVPSLPPSGPAPTVISAPPAPSPNVITLPESVTLPNTPPSGVPPQLAAPSASPEPASSAPPVEATNSIADLPPTAVEAPAILAPADEIGIPSQTGSLDATGPVDLSPPLGGSLLLPPGSTPPPTVSQNTPPAEPTFFERLLKPPSVSPRGKPAINGRNR